MGARKPAEEGDGDGVWKIRSLLTGSLPVPLRTCSSDFSSASLRRPVVEQEDYGAVKRFKTTFASKAS